MEPPPGFRRTFLAAASNGGLLLLQSFVAEFENGEGPEQVSYANLKAPDGRNALHWAAIAGETRICKYLIEILKFDVNSTDDNGETPLFPAVINGHLETATYLLENGADAAKRSNTGDTLLHRAAAKGSKELLKLLISKGGIMHLHANSPTGMPLHLTATLGNHDALEFLLDVGADPNSTTPTYMSPLLLSAFAQSVECMELLLKAGADANGHCLHLPPLFRAISIHNGWMVDLLLKAGADPNRTDFSGKTPLEHAALIGSYEVVEHMFPLTSPIAGYPEWSIMGFMKHIVSEKATALRVQAETAKFVSKSQGGRGFEEKKFHGCDILVSSDPDSFKLQALLADPRDAKAWNQRSLCYSHLNQGVSAVSDARDCLKLEPKWAKAHYSEGVAWNILKDYKKAAEAFSRALALDRGNKVFKKAYRAARAERKNGIDIEEDLIKGW